MNGEPAWRVHVPTADRTVVRLAVTPQPGMPWTGARALEGLGAVGVLRRGRPRAVGTGRGAPLLSSWELDWEGCGCHLEIVEGAIVEVVLELPSWDELSARVAEEGSLWELVDTLAAAVDAEHGALGDGEALQLEPPHGARDWAARLRSHLGLFVAGDHAAHACVTAGPAASSYVTLPRSRLCLLLR